MRRIEKEILKREGTDIGSAAKLAKDAGYLVSVLDGDGENGMCEPTLNFDRAPEFVGIVEQAKRMSIGRSHADMVVNGPVVLLSNGKEAVADYKAAFEGCWKHHGFWIASIFEDGHEVYA